MTSSHPVVGSTVSLVVFLYKPNSRLELVVYSSPIVENTLEKETND